jgi:hypothetical protein
MIDRHTHVALAPDVVLQIVDGSALLLKLHDEAVFTLNETGARIAQLIAEPRRLDAVAETLSREYRVDSAETFAEARALVETLIRRGLAVTREAGRE